MLYAWLSRLLPSYHICFARIEHVADASEFLRKHPWPGRSITDTFDDSTHRTGRYYKRFLSALKVLCGKTGDEDEYFDPEDADEERALFDVNDGDGSNYPFYWSTVLQQSFREELEKYAISYQPCSQF